MVTDIFIRTYSKDLPWLQYCLRSIHKFVTGYRQIIICIPANEQHLLKPWNLTQERVVAGIVGQNGYVLQQISKLTSHTETDAEYILFVDSDVCFKEPVNIESEYFRNGLPIVYETPWEHVGEARCWKAPTEEILGFEVDTETMRRLPIIYRRDTLRRLDERHRCLSLASRSTLSEFNLVGSYAKKYEPENYYFWNTIDDPNMPPDRIIQHWSWGGITNEIKLNLERILQ